MTGQITSKRKEANIVLIGYDAVSTQEFETRLNNILKDEPLFKHLNFKKRQPKFNIQSNVDVPVEVLEKFNAAQIVLNDEENRLHIDYFNFEKKLQVFAIDADSLDLFLELAKALVLEQTSQIKALGMNFIEDYEAAKGFTSFFNSTREAFDKTFSDSKDFQALRTGFAYKEDEFLKVFTISQENDALTINVNNHYDKFKTVLSSTKIKDSIIKVLDGHYKLLYKEFQDFAVKVIN